MTSTHLATHHKKNHTVLGIDVGTSGIRGAIVEFGSSTPKLRFSAEVTLPLPKREGCHSEQSPTVWANALNSLFQKLSEYSDCQQIDQCIVDATSSTVLLCDGKGNPLTQALMYDDQSATAEAKRVSEVAPQQTGAKGASSTLSKVMLLESTLSTTKDTSPSDRYICHQVDFINYILTGQLGITDENNALKLGYDSVQQQWPGWLKPLIKTPLPKVVPPGTEIGQIQPGLVKSYGFNPKMTVLSGTTDSIAAFLAAGANQIGDAVVSLGSTLAIKVLIDKPIFADQYGIYSHKLKSKWLVGGASNSGGAVLRHYFSLETLQALLAEIDISQPTGLDYYPLIRPGERFPIADAQLQPRLTPRPDNDALFCQAIMEGLVAIEGQCFERLVELGAPKIRQIYSCGGGTKNLIWMQLRQKHLMAPVTTAQQTDAAFGVTLLAKL
ncbi:carbohydrate kinase [Hydrogenovibrio sp. SC-1]|uniref:FGGY-family carbohydrate kinase n=1 Tax=Hydrogenovibrio sp. SC-1 TaxID=2065820 RepID=UPI000C7D9679|nr:FGGY-family carbohydrate kinase [Hydrogenovibrio sp. SC-1]PLA74166.1 carbohydrate kinase [Hydrogenovibrio sp. SC-1]